MPKRDEADKKALIEEYRALRKEAEERDAPYKEVRADLDRIDRVLDHLIGDDDPASKSTEKTSKRKIL